MSESCQQHAKIMASTCLKTNKNIAKLIVNHCKPTPKPFQKHTETMLDTYQNHDKNKQLS